MCFVKILASDGGDFKEEDPEQGLKVLSPYGLVHYKPAITDATATEY